MPNPRDPLWPWPEKAGLYPYAQHAVLRVTDDGDDAEITFSNPNEWAGILPHPAIISREWHEFWFRRHDRSWYTQWGWQIKARILRTNVMLLYPSDCNCWYSYIEAMVGHVVTRFSVSGCSSNHKDYHWVDVLQVSVDTPFGHSKEDVIAMLNVCKEVQ